MPATKQKSPFMVMSEEDKARQPESSAPEAEASRPVPEGWEGQPGWQDGDAAHNLERLRRAAPGLRQQRLQRMQHVQGNQHVQRVVRALQHGTSGEAAGAPLGLRGQGHGGPSETGEEQPVGAPAGPTADPAATTPQVPGSPSVQLDPSSLALQQTLPGHGDNGRGQAGGGQAAPGGGGGGGAGGVQANVSLTVNDPTVVRRPGGEIGAAHGRPNAVGWTTPSYNIAVPSLSPTSISVNVTLNFQMELASEYTGERLAVLSDHEQGHVTIGEQKAQEDLVDGLKGSLEAFPRFTSNPPIQAALRTAASNFVTHEGAASQAYDNADYPRMHEAYLGARTPLAELAAGAPDIAGMMAALSAFSAGAPGARPDQVSALARGVISARGALTQTNLNRLQYNPEFKAIVADCIAMAEMFIQAAQGEGDVQLDPAVWPQTSNESSESARSTLVDLQLTLSEFNWTAAV